MQDQTASLQQQHPQRRFLDPKTRRFVRARIREMHRTHTYAQIADFLNAHGIREPSGSPMSALFVNRMANKIGVRQSRARKQYQFTTVESIPGDATIKVPVTLPSQMLPAAREQQLDLLSGASEMITIDRFTFLELVFSASLSEDRKRDLIAKL